MATLARRSLQHEGSLMSHDRALAGTAAMQLHALPFALLLLGVPRSGSALCSRTACQPEAIRSSQA
jgi:hypothetical protein